MDKVCSGRFVCPTTESEFEWTGLYPKGSYVVNILYKNCGEILCRNNKLIIPLECPYCREIHTIYKEI